MPYKILNLKNFMSGIPEIVSEYSDKFRRIQVSGVFGGVVAGGLEATIYSEQRDIEKVLATAQLAANLTKIKRVIECELIIDPMQMKSIHKWLGKKIGDYEELFSKIPSPEEVQSRSKRSKGQGSTGE